MTLKIFAEKVTLPPKYKPTQKESWKKYGFDFSLVEYDYAVAFYIIVRQGKTDKATKHSILLAGAWGPVEFDK